MPRPPVPTSIPSTEPDPFLNSVGAVPKVYTIGSPKTPRKDVRAGKQKDPVDPTPNDRASTRRQAEMILRMCDHRFGHKFVRKTCAVTNKSSSFASFVQASHMMRFSISNRELYKWEWCLGYPYAHTLNVDTRINGMFLWVDIHQMVDRQLLCFVLTDHQMDKIQELLNENVASKEPSRRKERKHIPYELDKQMPTEGWLYDAILWKQEGNRSENIQRHSLEETIDKKWQTSPKVTLHSSPCNIQFGSAASPVFVLAHFWELLGTRDADSRRAFWPPELVERAERMSALVFIVMKSDVPHDFLKKPRNIKTRRAAVECADYLAPLPSYDYRLWPQTSSGDAKQKDIEPASDLPSSRPPTPDPEEEAPGIDDSPTAGLGNPNHSGMCCSCVRRQAS